VQHHPAVEGFVRGLSLAVVGIFVVVLMTLLHGAGFSGRSIAIALASLGLAATRRVPVVAILALAGLTGVFLRGA
jgi:chromate transport protein ChrA